jgi:hypothetical protein
MTSPLSADRAPLQPFEAGRNLVVSDCPVEQSTAETRNFGKPQPDQLETFSGVDVSIGFF